MLKKHRLFGGSWQRDADHQFPEYKLETDIDPEAPDGFFTGPWEQLFDALGKGGLLNLAEKRILLVLTGLST